MLTSELESGLKCTQQVAKLSFRDHNKTNPKLVLSSSKYHTVFPNYAQVFQGACFFFFPDIPMKIFSKHSSSYPPVIHVSPLVF